MNEGQNWALVRENFEIDSFLASKSIPSNRWQNSVVRNYARVILDTSSLDERLSYLAENGAPIDRIKGLPISQRARLGQSFVYAIGGIVEDGTLSGVIPYTQRRMDEAVSPSGLSIVYNADTAIKFDSPPSPTLISRLVNHKSTTDVLRDYTNRYGSPQQQTWGIKTPEELTEEEIERVYKTAAELGLAVEDAETFNLQKFLQTLNYARKLRADLGQQFREDVPSFLPRLEERFYRGHNIAEVLVGLLEEGVGTNLHLDRFWVISKLNEGLKADGLEVVVDPEKKEMYERHVESILPLHPRLREMRDINPDSFSNLASIFTESIEELFSNAAFLYGEGNHYSPSLILTLHKVPLYVNFLGFVSDIAGVGDRTSGGQAYVNIHHNPSSEQEIYEDYGIKSSVGFSLSLHTDEATKNQIQTLLSERKISYEAIGTTYRCDRDGNYTKIVSLPLEIEDDRPVHHTDDYYKYIQTEMTSGDFDILVKIVTAMQTLWQNFRPTHSTP
jgi:hypothetical protein